MSTAVGVVQNHGMKIFIYLVVAGIVSFLVYLLVKHNDLNKFFKSEGYGNVKLPFPANPFGDSVKPEDLLPKDPLAQAQLGPVDDTVNRNYLFPDAPISGINTIANHRKIANLQERPDPVIEKKVISPFLNSSVDQQFQPGTAFN